MQAVDACMKRQGKSGASLPCIRDEVFLHVWAPVMTEYVEWVLEEALKSGKKRLYFLARDGYMMYLLAGILVKAGSLDLEIRYLKISRYAIRSAEYYFAGKEALDTLCAGGMDVSFEKVMKRANLDEEEARFIAKLAGYEKNYQTGLDHRQLCRLKKDLFPIDRLFACIREHSRGCYETAISYFRQEGLFQDIPYALVDSGWIGTLQYSLQRVLEHETGKKFRIQGYYFGIYERPEGTVPDQYREFYFGKREIRKKIRFSNCLFETVFSAPEGMTLGYGISGRTSEPVCEALEKMGGNPNAEVMRHFAELLLEYGTNYTAAEDRKKLSCDTAENDRNALRKDSSDNKRKKRVRFVERLLKPMMGSPTRLEAEAFGELLFCDDVLEKQVQPAAARWEEKELRKRRFWSRILMKMNLKTGTLHESAWAEGSIMRLGKQVRKNMRQERFYKSFMYLRKAIGK